MIAAAVLAAGMAVLGIRGPAAAGEIADRAAEAEALLSAGDAAGALAAFDEAADIFRAALPLATRVAVLADDIRGYASFSAHDGTAYPPGSSLRVYLEPVGVDYVRDGAGVAASLAIDVEIRTPGGIILASASDFGRLDWKARHALGELYASVEVPLPDLKPGDYQLVVTLRQAVSGEAATVALPFSVGE